ncbi:HD domain-containing protein [Actinoallomurus rhizosphaericola]|uniref:HD domain-containing protein n=1 Tax=Actinoallomurus rhizosphaericola TaxID=2952536 RepID=UPI002090A835|nr:HD domain-containing protein [Actinoallomurus rhizosphaericola]MCO5994575.1 HD domain-containing protein [Actinoallomurus rhizosphaericola]
MPEELARLTEFVYEMGLLKRYKRSGWLVAGVAAPESIADHSFRAAVLAGVLAALEGASPERAVLLSLFHDSQETRLTDLPYLAQRYVARTPNEQVTANQVRGLPAPVAELISGSVAEYEQRASLEARCARDADKLECLLQAIEYRDQGHHTIQPWIDSSLAALQTPSGKKLADEALATGSLDWLHGVVNGENGPVAG